MSVRDLLDKIISKDVEGMQAEFDVIMAERVGAAIDDKRIEVAQSMFGEGKTEYEIGKDEKEAEDAEDEADEAEKKLEKDKKGSDDSDDDSGDEDDKKAK